MALIHVPQGHHVVSDDPAAVMTTVLGSCVAACLYDPGTGIGGMTHFLLPRAASPGARQVLHGAQAMEILIAALLREGARRKYLTAKLFGGARVVDGLSDIGAENAAFAEAFLESEAIPVVGQSLGSTAARRVRFYPTSGQAQVKRVPKVEAPAIEPTPPPRQLRQPDVTLF